MRRNAEMSFLEVRAEAIRWADEREAPQLRPRAHSCAADVQLASVHGSSNSISESVNKQADLKECLRKQQGQLDVILKHLSLNTADNVGGTVGHLHWRVGWGGWAQMDQ